MIMLKLKKKFDTRDELIAFVKTLAPWAQGESSFIQGGRHHAEITLKKIRPMTYARTRNYGDGVVSKLSPYIHHGVLSLNEVRNHALTTCNQPEQISKFIQELAWRDFWQRTLSYNSQWAWEDVEAYKTGFSAKDYANNLPDDISQGRTGVACLDTFIQELTTTGYIHNHARMYLASYIVHFRRISWQTGARWFLQHLLDGDVASNNFSWQWVASTFSHKPYIFNQENVDKYFHNQVDTSSKNNQLLDASYPELQRRLFPHMGGTI
jgi:deoxyribodipyrimidine photo-lyase